MTSWLGICWRVTKRSAHNNHHLQQVQFRTRSQPSKCQPTLMWEVPACHRWQENLSLLSISREVRSETPPSDLEAKDRKPFRAAQVTHWQRGTLLVLNRLYFLHFDLSSDADLTSAHLKRISKSHFCLLACLRIILTLFWSYYFDVKNTQKINGDALPASKFPLKTRWKIVPRGSTGKHFSLLLRRNLLRFKKFYEVYFFKGSHDIVFEIVTLPLRFSFGWLL